jgi:hypothetical protein
VARRSVGGALPFAFGSPGRLSSSPPGPREPDPPGGLEQARGCVVQNDAGRSPPQRKDLVLIITATVSTDFAP